MSPAGRGGGRDGLDVGAASLPSWLAATRPAAATPRGLLSESDGGSIAPSGHGAEFLPLSPERYSSAAATPASEHHHYRQHYSAHASPATPASSAATMMSKHTVAHVAHSSPAVQLTSASPGGGGGGGFEWIDSASGCLLLGAGAFSPSGSDVATGAHAHAVALQKTPGSRSSLFPMSPPRSSWAGQGFTPTDVSPPLLFEEEEEEEEAPVVFSLGRSPQVGGDGAAAATASAELASRLSSMSDALAAMDCY